MKIALNAQLIDTSHSYRGAGVSNYSQGLLAALGEMAQTGATEHRFVAYLNDRQFAAGGIVQRLASPRLRQPAVRILWEQCILPLQLAGDQAELVHGLVNVLPLATMIPGVVTVHDLSFMHMPEKFSAFKRFYHAQLCRSSVQKAKLVIAVSQQTADDLIQTFATPPGKIRVVYNGVSPAFSPGDPMANAAFRRQQGLPERYLLYVGTLEPRKNLELLVRAFARWRRQASSDFADVKLVIGGGKGWFYESIFAEVRRCQEEEWVIFPGFIPEQEYVDWLRAAYAFVYPSLFEGFGLPVLEAMACGTPVLCSRIPSLLEVAGEAAYFFAATSEEELAHGFGQLTSDVPLRHKLQVAGPARAAFFSWRRCAESTCAVYNEALLGKLG
jgi:glycosyltransferase involved in cell wall biosynthesis